MAALHAAGIEFDRRRETACRAFSLALPAQTIVHETLKRTDIRMVGARTIRPLQFAKDWAGVTCKKCKSRRSLYEANQIPFTVVEAI